MFSIAVLSGQWVCSVQLSVQVSECIQYSCPFMSVGVLSIAVVSDQWVCSGGCVQYNCPFMSVDVCNTAFLLGSWVFSVQLFL